MILGAIGTLLVIGICIGFSSLIAINYTNKVARLGIQQIDTENAPGAIGPYSQGIIADNLLFVAGQIGLKPDGTFDYPDFNTPAGQTRQALENAGNILKEAGLDFRNVVKATVLLKDINDYDEVNAVYAQYFEDPFPARSAFQVAALPRASEGTLVEIELIALKTDKFETAE